MQNAKFKAMQYAKNFELELEKNALGCFEFICEVLKVIAEYSKMRI